MENFDRKKHWEDIYQSKQLNEVSWFQQTPKISLDFIKQLKVPKSAKIIDIGGGDSFLVDHLLGMGYQDITVLDISESALRRARKRLGTLADKVKWIVADVATFVPTGQYDFWHDRAAFHFLTEEQDIASYLENAQRSIMPDGMLILGTFSKQGPQKCSGIEIKQYSESTMTTRLRKFFEKIKCITVDHKTPFDTIQNFTFCSFRKLPIDPI
ncbi:class I SAM-dependent methyltransferase [Ekhidna sp.]|uniref:class I SAM-dependent methyltransferase n=1 Tax=Ekhidna sp. TaxID=2608089 RepID=UPI0032F04857